MKLDLPDFGEVSTGELERVCSELEVAQLEAILRKYIGTEDMFTQQYLYGVKENVQLLVDIGKAVETREAGAAADMYAHLKEREPLFVRSLVSVFKAWYAKTADLRSEVIGRLPGDFNKCQWKTPRTISETKMEEECKEVKKEGDE
jgi:hypothetical protein